MASARRSLDADLIIRVQCVEEKTSNKAISVGMPSGTSRPTQEKLEMKKNEPVQRRKCNVRVTYCVRRGCMLDVLGGDCVRSCTNLIRYIIGRAAAACSVSSLMFYLLNAVTKELTTPNAEII